MKKLIKFGVVLFIGGLIATFIGWRMGGAQPVAIGRDWKPKIIKEEVRTKTLPTINQIDLKVQDANVAIRKGDHYGIKLVDRNVGKPTYSVSNHKLIVTQPQFNQFDGGTIDWQAEPVHNIIITVPATATLANVKINSADGQINLTDANVKQLSVNQQDGALYVTRGEIKKLTFENTDGNVQLTQLRLTDAQGMLRDGSFEMTNGELKQKLVVQNNDGTNRVTGIQAKGYYLQTTDGTNRLKGKTSPDPIMRDTNQTPLIKLTNRDGNNIVN